VNVYRRSPAPVKRTNRVGTRVDPAMLVYFSLKSCMREPNGAGPSVIDSRIVPRRAVPDAEWLEVVVPCVVPWTYPEQQA
jgi:hypothetical protein